MAVRRVVTGHTPGKAVIASARKVAPIGDRRSGFGDNPVVGTRRPGPVPRRREPAQYLGSISTSRWMHGGSDGVGAGGR